jgi:hypothetical protein
VWKNGYTTGEAYRGAGGESPTVRHVLMQYYKSFMIVCQTLEVNEEVADRNQDGLAR